MTEIIKDMKLRKFQVEGILGYLQSGNYEFKVLVWTIQKNIKKYSKTITSWNIFFLFKDKLSVYKMSVSIARKWKKEEIRRSGKKERKGEKRNSLKKRKNIVDRWSQLVGR